jgi:Tfp pilus assembly protein PilX
MAGNMRDLDIALQAAETSARYAQDQLGLLSKESVCSAQEIASPCGMPDANGLWCTNGVQVHDEAWWNTWGVKLQQDATKQVEEAWEDPRHTAEYLERVKDDASPDSESTAATLYLRISARGVGRTAFTETLVRRAFAVPCP